MVHGTPYARITPQLRKGTPEDRLFGYSGPSKALKTRKTGIPGPPDGAQEEEEAAADSASKRRLVRVRSLS